MATIIIEPSRLKIRSPFISTLNKICKKKKIILIVDEITSGWRDCTGGIYKKLGIKPSIVVYGKALGNGFAISALVGKKNVMDLAQDTFISSVAWTERVGFSAALAVINFHKKNNVFVHNKKLVNTLETELSRKPKMQSKIKTNSLDTIVYFEFLYKNRNDYLQTLFTELMQKRILANNLIYISYSHKLNHVRKYLRAVDKSFQKISNSIKKLKYIEE